MTNINKGDMLVVGISGCSGSGKSTLAETLRRVFTTAAIRGMPESEAKKFSVFLIQADDYFRREAGVYSTARFRPVSPIDNEVMSDAVLGPAKRADGSYVLRDKDCSEYVDFAGVEGAIRAVLEGKGEVQTPPDDTTQRVLMEQDAEEEVEEEDKEGSGYGEAVELVSKAFRAGLWRWDGIVLVEGFLLFPPLSDVDIFGGGGAPDGDQHRADENNRNKWAMDFSGRKRHPGDNSRVHPDTPEAHTELRRLTQENIRAACRISDTLLDLRLFLPLDRAAAAWRRHQRLEYRDQSGGGGRLPGQFWKSMGYFEDVAWSVCVRQREGRFELI